MKMICPGWLGMPQERRHEIEVNTKDAFDKKKCPVCGAPYIVVPIQDGDYEIEGVF